MLPPLQSLLVFETIARRKSLALAAEELHLTPSAVSHRLKNLEAFLGLQLLERSSKGVSPTPAGEAYLSRLTGALGAISAATDDVRQGLKNSLYVHVSPSFASLWLMPRLPQFTAAHPEISLFLSASHLHSDFSQAQVDVDIRYGLPNWQGVVAEPILEERIMPLAAPSFIAKHGLHALQKNRHFEFADLLALPLIQSTVSLVQWRDWFAYCDKNFDSKRLPERFALRFDRAMMSLDAAVQGMGVALESNCIAQTHIASGKLQALFSPRLSVPIQGHYVVYPERHAGRIEVQQFLIWLKTVR